MRDLTLPAICDVSVTNVCNAGDFCGFARDKTLAGAARYLDAEAFSRALPILYRRGIRYLTLQGGEPLVNPEVVRLGLYDDQDRHFLCGHHQWMVSTAAYRCAGRGRVVAADRLDRQRRLGGT